MCRRRYNPSKLLESFENIYQHSDGKYIRQSFCFFYIYRPNAYGNIKILLLLF